MVFRLNLKKLAAFSNKLFSRLRQEKNSALCPFRSGLFELIPFKAQNLAGHDKALDLLGAVPPAFSLGHDECSFMILQIFRQSSVSSLG